MCISKMQEMHYKETDPVSTVDKLQSKLKELNLEVIEEWGDESCVGTYSLRVTFKGTTIGSNGKGVNKEYARASAYAELFERFQNGLLSTSMVPPKYDKSFNFRIAPDEKTITAEEIVKENNPFIQYYFKVRGMANASFEEKVNSYKEVNKIEKLMYDMDNQFDCIPFYNVREQKVSYMPRWTYTKYYGSNGMAAGNTPEEALVQGMSEIFERVAQKRIFKEQPCLPDIPDDYIANFPQVYEMYQKLKSIKDYEVKMKDCSFGGKYPVAALVILQKNTGKYGLKMGCHPDMGIAMERTFTEAAQGNDILEYVNRSVIDFMNKNVSNDDNIVNSFKIGLAQYPYQIFGSSPDYEFIPVENVSHLNNTEILKKWIKEILDEGYDILIRDVSNLGFPSYHILIPGMSELNDGSDTATRADNTRAFISGLLIKPSLINKENVKFILASLGYYSKRIMENSLSSFYPESGELDLPYEDIGFGNIYLSAMCYIMLGQYENAFHKIKILEQNARIMKVDNDKLVELMSIGHYLAAMSQIHDHTTVMGYMRILFDDKLCERIDYLFADPNQVISKQYQDYTNPAVDSHFSSQQILNEIYNKLRKSRIENRINQESLKTVFA